MKRKIISLGLPLVLVMAATIYFLWPYFTLSNDIPYVYTEEGIPFGDEVDPEGLHHLYVQTEEGACEEGGDIHFYNKLTNTIYIFLYSKDRYAWSGDIICTMEVYGRDIEFVSKDTEMPEIKVYYYWHRIPLYDKWGGN